MFLHWLVVLKMHSSCPINLLYCCRGVTEARVGFLSLAVLALCTVISALSEQRYSRLATSRTTVHSEQYTQSHYSQLDKQEDDRTSMLVKNSQNYGYVRVWYRIIGCWTMIMLLLARPHNIPLVVFLYFQEICLRHIIASSARVMAYPAAITLIYLAMGHAAFFYQVL